MISLLSIGNSFSQDAHRWLYDIATAAGVEVECVNLYIGGCSLKQHWHNAESGEVAYEYELNAVMQKRVALLEALREQAWDIVTLQQVSGHSGRPASYLPYLPDLAALVRQECPNARLYFHQTWSYEVDSDHGDFPAYNRDQREMDRRIADAAEMACKLIGVPLIPTGEVIRRLRQLPAFDYPKGGLSLHRDGFHLSWDYGRYAAAATWCATLFERDLEKSAAFLPPDTDPALLSAIRRVVGEVC
ncbi:MAG: DUF4886 domain-containing protein [Clostridia bacterium]|nr:DUF4886 domain-containing protein [Clostridia bacterium]